MGKHFVQLPTHSPQGSCNVRGAAPQTCCLWLFGGEAAPAPPPEVTVHRPWHSPKGAGDVVWAARPHRRRR